MFHRKITIDLRKLGRNVELIEKSTGCPRKVMMAVVKEDAYGHGVREVVSYLYNIGVKKFGVAWVEEGVLLRESGIPQDAEIYVLGGVLNLSELEESVKNHLIPVISDFHMLDLISKMPALDYYLKFDTGMGRLGFLPSDSGKVLDFIEKRKIKPPAGVISHLSSADEDEDYTSLQVESYYRLLKFFESRFGRMKRQIANSAYLLLNGYEERMGIVRLGIAIYGASPSKDLSTSLEECMSFESIIWQVKRMKKGSRISYGGEAVLGRDSIIGVVPVGYAHGYPRVVTGKAKVIVKGRKVPVVGRVTMDWIMVDLTDVGWLEKGEVVTIMGKSGGESISSWDIATWSGTIPYEIFCLFGKSNKREYIRG